MTTEIRFNGNGVPRVYLKPSDNPIEEHALKQLIEASNKGTVVTLTDEGGVAVLTVRSGVVTPQRPTVDALLTTDMQM